MPFQFKQFQIDDDGCTLKVGTDAVLLGAIADCVPAKSILDIGTGSGIIALMLAQRSRAGIDAIEIDEISFLKAKQNFSTSPWPERLTAIHGSFQGFSTLTNKTYDLIVSNPPFFSNSYKPSSESKQISKHNVALDFMELVSGVAKLLGQKGKFSLVLPYSEKENFIQIAKTHNLSLNGILDILPKNTKKPNRAILEFGKDKTSRQKTTSIFLRNPDNSYSEEYRQVTKDFHPFY
ncbi:MAG: methyltransferase [Chlorobi bacterium]|nr:methyltransferase [Chlorobiota bacterium]